MITGELEDWLCEIGHIVVRKQAAGTPLSSQEQLIYEIWLLYTETRNGGLSQYFCNHGSEQWRCCVATALAGGVASFRPFAVRVDEMIAGAIDPYDALIEEGQFPDNVYYEYESSIVEELRAKYSTVA